MKPSKAIALLTIPLAISWMVLWAGMCLTPYWTCSVQVTFTPDIWKPALFGLLIFSLAAALVLCIDLLLINHLMSKTVRYRLVTLAVIGGIVATLPRMLLWVFSGGAKIGALPPQVELLPFAVAGATFALVLNWLLTLSKK